MELIHYHFDTIDSTNTWAKKNAAIFQQDKVTLVTANTQTAGRGRFKRHWVSPPGQNIYASFCFFMAKDCPWLGNIPQVAALSIARILEALGFHPELKWPNDILLNEKKVAGILTETVTPDTKANKASNKLCMIIGIGLNVNMPANILSQIDRPATSLLVEKQHAFDVVSVLNLLQSQFLSDLESIIKNGFQYFFKEYAERISLAAKKIVQFNDNTKTWTGSLHQINPDGSLSLLLDSGEIKKFFTGEILFNAP